MLCIYRNRKKNNKGKIHTFLTSILVQRRVRLHICFYGKRTEQYQIRVASWQHKQLFQSSLNMWAIRRFSKRKIYRTHWLHAFQKRKAWNISHTRDTHGKVQKVEHELRFFFFDDSSMLLRIKGFYTFHRQHYVSLHEQIIFQYLLFSSE